MIGSIDSHLGELLRDMNALLRDIDGIKSFFRLKIDGFVGGVYHPERGKNKAAVYRILEDQLPHSLADLLIDVNKIVPEPIDMEKLRQILKEHCTIGKDNGFWDCNVKSGIAQMIIHPEPLDL